MIAFMFIIKLIELQQFQYTLHFFLHFFQVFYILNCFSEWKEYSGISKSSKNVI